MRQQCNFTPPTGNDPALLTHDEVTTLFHEFGHGLQHMLTKIDYLGVSGINGVEWDAVELPSQFMENWCWEKESLQLVSGHYQTGETLPDSLFDQNAGRKKFPGWHGDGQATGIQPVSISRFIKITIQLLAVGSMKRWKKYGHKLPLSIRPNPTALPHSFSHIFAGGYAAGYYSYKWAEVLSSDAFSLFEEKGIFNQEAGKRFLIQHTGTWR